MKIIQLERVVSFPNLAIHYVKKPTSVTSLPALHIVFSKYHNPFRDHLADTGRKHRKEMDLMSSVRKGIAIKYRIIFIFGLREKM